MKRSKFSLSNYRLATFDMGELVPVGMFEVLPGDTIQHATAMLLRCSPLLSPVMHPVRVRLHHWFVPNRLIWDEWEDFITGGPSGTSAPSYPTCTAGGGGFAVGSLADYLGVPTGIASLQVSALPFRAYALIWNEFYRDEDLQTPLTISRASGPDTTTSTTLQSVNWEKDYFTTARPWPQKGNAITLPLSGLAPILGLGADAGTSSLNSGIATTSAGDWSSQPTINTGSTQFRIRTQTTGTVSASNRPQVFADLSAAGGPSINDLREAFAIQRYMENRARYGSRFTEYLAFLGIRSSDSRLRRPEYLGGGKQTIQFSEVLQTGGTSTGVSTGVGNMTGHGMAALRSNRYRRFFEEHGWVITLASVVPRTMYHQGLARHWNRRIKEDFWQKELQFVGQQKVLNKEVFAGHAAPNGTFGFQDRYDEYRRQESYVSGEFRSLLDFWHYGRTFASSPALNSAFVTAVPTKRVNAVQTNDVLWNMCNHSIQARRLVARDGSPGGV